MLKHVYKDIIKVLIWNYRAIRCSSLARNNSILAHKLWVTIAVVHSLKKWMFFYLVLYPKKEKNFFDGKIIHLLY